LLFKWNDTFFESAAHWSASMLATDVGSSRTESEKNFIGKASGMQSAKG